MKLRNKKTGEIGELKQWLNRKDRSINGVGVYISADKPFKQYASLAELNAEWEDHKEPNGWCVTMYGGISRLTKDDDDFIPELKEIGNYFNDKESAYDGLEKLKAWKRLEDKGVKFKLDFVRNTIHFTYRIDGTLHSVVNEERIIFEDMKTIFGGENEATE